MHKCINKSKGDVGHLEQMVDNFFPYSQKALSFDKPISIIFQSDEENATKMLGKTAFYNPANLEIVLYVDSRHPKDILRSLSHELVHHAQHCRGDFGQGTTEPGYAQKDPHMRKMEREAYTKGNLIFRDFEDLIKTGKINIEIDFSDSGEPTMSLNEWKNNELNMLLMKKWGLLKEDKNQESEDLEEVFGLSADEKRKKLARRPEFSAGGPKEDDPGVDPPLAHTLEKAQTAKGPPGKPRRRPRVRASDIGRGASTGMKIGGITAEGELEEGHEHGPECGCPDQDLEEGGMSYRDDDDKKGDEIDEGGRGRPSPGGAEARHLGQNPDTYVGPALGRGMAGKTKEPGTDPDLARAYGVGEPEGEPEPWRRGRVTMRAITGPDDPRLKTNPTPEYSGTKAKARSGSRSAAHLRGAPRENQEFPRKISVREAKDITRRIIKRIRKEAK